MVDAEAQAALTMDRRDFAPRSRMIASFRSVSDWHLVSLYRHRSNPENRYWVIFDWSGGG